MPNPSRSEEYDRTDMSFLFERIEFMRRNGVEYILFITRDKYDTVHSKLIFFLPEECTDCKITILLLPVLEFIKNRIVSFS